MKPRHEREEIVRKAARVWLSPEACQKLEDVIEHLVRDNHDLIECYGIAPARRGGLEGAACWVVFHQEGMSSVDMDVGETSPETSFESLIITKGIYVDESRRSITVAIGLDDIRETEYVFPSLDLWRWASRLILTRLEAYRLWDREIQEEADSFLAQVEEGEQASAPLTSMVNWRAVGEALGNEFGRA